MSAKDPQSAIPISVPSTETFFFVMVCNKAL